MLSSSHSHTRQAPDKESGVGFGTNLSILSTVTLMLLSLNFAFDQPYSSLDNEKF